MKTLSALVVSLGLAATPGLATETKTDKATGTITVHTSDFGKKANQSKQQTKTRSLSKKKRKFSEGRPLPSVLDQARRPSFGCCGGGGR